MPAQRNNGTKTDHVYSDDSFDEDSYQSDNEARNAGRGSVIQSRLISASTNMCPSVQSTTNSPHTNPTNSRNLQFKSQLLRNKGIFRSTYN